MAVRAVNLQRPRLLLHRVPDLERADGPAIGAGNPDGGDFYVHLDLAGVRLRADLRLVVRPKADHAGRLDLIRGDVFFWGEIMAGALIAAIPMATAYNLFLDRFIAGITGGAVK